MFQTEKQDKIPEKELKEMERQRNPQKQRDSQRQRQKEA